MLSRKLGLADEPSSTTSRTGHLHTLGDDPSAPVECSYNYLCQCTDNFSESRKLGEGGTGAVFLAKDGDRQFAVKRVTLEEIKSKFGAAGVRVAERSIRREFDALIQLQAGDRPCKHIMPLLGFCFPNASSAASGISQGGGGGGVKKDPESAFCRRGRRRCCGCSCDWQCCADAEVHLDIGQ